MKFKCLYILLLLFFCANAQSICNIDAKEFYNNDFKSSTDSLGIGTFPYHSNFDLYTHWFHYEYIDSTNYDIFKKYYANNYSFDRLDFSHYNPYNLFINNYNDTIVNSWNLVYPTTIFNTGPSQSNCYNNHIYNIYKPIVDNTYIGTTVASFKFSNLKDQYTIVNNDTFVLTYSLDTFSKTELIYPNVLINNNVCDNNLYPECNSYKLVFYTRPYKIVSFINGIENDSIGRPGNQIYTTDCLYSSLNFNFLDSLSLQIMTSFQNTYEIDLANSSQLNDTTKWTKIEKVFSVLDTTITLSLKSHFDFDNYYTNNLNGIEFTRIMDSLELNNTNGYLYYGKINVYYLFDSFSLEPLGYENLDLCLPDTSFCESFSINVDAYQPEFTHYEWSTGDTTASINIDSPGVYSLRAYYPCGVLCDEFTVFEEPANYLLPLSYGDTLAICPLNLPITLNAAGTFASYSWSNGDTTFSTSVNHEGMVYLETQHFCGTLRDSVYLKLRDKENIDLNPFTDTLICASDLPFTLQINDTLQNYMWSNGATTFQNTFDAAGSYFVNADNDCHYYTDTFTLQTESLATGNFKHQNIYCPEDFPIVLTAPSALNPNWNTGENTNSITVNNAVNDVYVHNSFSVVCGSRTDSFFVYVLPDTISQLPQILIDDFCLEEGFYQFSTIVNDTNFIYQWENQTSLNFTTKGGTTQTLSISNACLSLEIDTFIERCPEQIAFALPTAFSPNNDGVNDVFQLLYLNPNYQFKNLKIYNRWGELIFNNKDKTIGWNGTYKNKNAPIGNYIYHLELLNDKQEIETFKGNLSLIR